MDLLRTTATPTHDSVLEQLADRLQPAQVLVAAVCMCVLGTGAWGYNVWFGRALTLDQGAHASAPDALEQLVEPASTKFPQTTLLGTLTETDAQDSPFQARVAGAQTTNSETQVGFSLVGEPTEQVLSVLESNLTPAAQPSCEQVVFRIGDRESTPQSHPADELSWVGAQHVLPEFSNPFIVGTHESASFPWRSGAEVPDSASTVIQFMYQGNPTVATLTLGWSPGKHGTQQKHVRLDGLPVGSTPERAGKLQSGSWEQMQFFEDSLELQLNPGMHELVLDSISQDDDPAVWDFIELVSVAGCT